MTVFRFEDNPLISPSDVRPWIKDFEVVCVFNAGCARLGDEILLLLRVAEAPPSESGVMAAPILDLKDPSSAIKTIHVSMNDPNFGEIDSRLFSYKGQTYLTSISHFRIARSTDGRHFSIDDEPAMVPENLNEEYGIEDPRITKIGDEYYINYTAVSRNGIATALSVTRDFRKFDRKGIIFVPENRDITIFPEKVNGQYVCYHRPAPRSLGSADIWFASSPDLIHWGNHHYVCGARKGMWDEYKIGGGAVPIKTDRGWLEIYHGANHDQRYCLGVLLADLQHPEKVIARSAEPLLAPETDYEQAGFFGQVIFTCGTVTETDGRVIIYYGAADECTCGAETSVDEMLSMME